ncbi:MAG: hypothetical protein JWO38_5351 [Gemmataceae bacterium]|nr:hypothetical protein [Gemmataceae bacterium]
MVETVLFYGIGPGRKIVIKKWEQTFRETNRMG